MKQKRSMIWVLAGTVFLSALPARPQENHSPMQLFSGALGKLSQMFQAATNEPPRTFTASVKVLKAEGLPKQLVKEPMLLAFQAPDHLRLQATWDGQQFVLCRDQQEVWVYAPGKKFGLVGSPDVPFLSSVPNGTEAKALEPMQIPMPAQEYVLLPRLVRYEALADAQIDGNLC
jgi:hypothetical protein